LMSMTIKELRKQKGLTQKQASDLTQIPLRTYKNYENDSDKNGSIKYNYIFERLREYGKIDETHGVLTLDMIKSVCGEVFSESDVDYCILFGSYSRGTANELSDIDLLISTDISGLKYFGIVETLREKLHKKIDLLDLRQLDSNPELLNSILKDGIRIYVQE